MLWRKKGLLPFSQRSLPPPPLLEAQPSYQEAHEAAGASRYFDLERHPYFSSGGDCESDRPHEEMADEAISWR
jgi:hypothetical protein